MNHLKRFFFILYPLSFILLTSCGGGGKPLKFVTIGTGGVTGVYYPTGGAIAKIINDNVKTSGLKATVEATGGSVFNINSIAAGDLDFGIAQSDAQYQAYNGLAEWEGHPVPKLRSVFSLHSEAVTLIASDKSGIQQASDMKGKIIAIGNPGSGHRGNALDALTAYGMSTADIKAEDIKPAECAGMLQDGRIDAYFYTVGHPNGSIKEAVAGTTPVHFVPLTRMDSLIITHPYYTKAVIPIQYYEGISNTSDVETFGVKATLVTSADLDTATVYEITRLVFENIAEFKNLHPALEHLTREQMLEGMSAPIHPGAAKYYREAGLMKEVQMMEEAG